MLSPARLTTKPVLSFLTPLLITLGILFSIFANAELECGVPAPVELAIELEIARVKTDRYEAPYLAIWLEPMTGGDPVTLLLLGEKRRWQKELLTWWRTARHGSRGEYDAITSATRGPGEYRYAPITVQNVLPTMDPGRYTLYIESAREYGERNLVSAPFLFADVSGPLVINAPGDVGAVSVSVQGSLETCP